MKTNRFDELLTSVREGGAILRGEMLSSRSFDHVSTALDVKAFRETYGLTQPDFAVLLGISVATLRNWEQGRRTPDGPARVLLRVAAMHLQALWDTVRPGADSRSRKSTA